jgi:peroxiredoxin Q/BCP
MKEKACMKRICSILVLVLTTVAILPAQNSIQFELNSATDDSRFRLSDAKGKYVALHFLLKTECPYCIRHTQEYFSKAELLPDVIQIFIKPDPINEIRTWATKLPDEKLATYPVYHDPDAKLAEKFNIPGGYSFHGQVMHYPALILIGPDGREVFRYIGKNNTDRYSFDQLAGKIRELKK